MGGSNARPAFVALLVLALAGCQQASPPAGAGHAEAGGADAGQAEAAHLDRQEVAGSVVDSMDRAADPCQDFYQYACGSWIAKTEIPADQSRWARSFSVIAERNRTVLREILEETAKDPGGDADRAKLGNFYKTCMDEGAADAQGAKPLEPMLAEIDKVGDVPGLMTMVAKLQSVGVGALMDMEAQPDFKDPGLDILHVGQGGLGLPDRDYYLKDDERSQDLRKEYEAHVARMLALSGEAEAAAAKHAKAILAFETELAKVSWPREEMRNPEKIYHRLELEGLQSLTPRIPWDTFLAATGHPGVTQINVATPPFFEGLQKIVTGGDFETIRAYLRWQLVTSTAPLLSKDFVDEDFAFFGQTLQGQKENRPRWKRCVIASDGALGEILGKLYVERMFAGDSKKIALEMIRDIESAFEANLQNLAWMDESTRQRAKEKTAAIYNKIGYPDKWLDYSSLKADSSSYFANALEARHFEFERQAKKVGQPVDKTEWFMTPPTVNAYYNPLFNEMVFPAGVMQRPFFNRDFPAAMNYGGIGMGMGHELTHGFDDEGRKFDAQGRMTQWWDDSAVEKFEKASVCVEKLYDGYEVQPGLHLNGKLTLGENIADLGGLKGSYNAYKSWEKRHGVPEPLVEGLTDNQLFFVAAAQTWCSKSTPEIERMMVTVNPHSAERFRVIGPLSNFPAFAEAFSCAPGTPMNPVDKCEVW